ncbi:uncharacterized protein LOC142335479 isoform X2 [Convolutriloba macropyga]
MGVLSVIGCLIYLYCFFFLQTVHSYARKLIAFIAFTEGMCILGNVSGIVYMKTASESTFSDFGEPGYPYNCTPKLPTPDSDQFCQIQGFFSNFFSISSFIFNSGLAILMLQITWSNRPSKSLYWTINTLAFLVPISVTTAVAAKGLYGFSTCTTGGWCWLRQINNNTDSSKHTEFLWQTIAGKFWELMTEAILVVCYVSLVVVLKFKQRMSRNRGASVEVLNTLEAVEALYKRLLLTPIVFFFCYIFGTIRSYVLLAHDTHEMNHAASDFLSFMHGFGNNATGFCNFVIFVLLHRQMREDLWSDIVLKYRHVCDALFYRRKGANGDKSVGSTSALYAPRSKYSSRNNESGFVSSTSTKQKDPGYSRQMSDSYDSTWNSGDSDYEVDVGGDTVFRDGLFGVEGVGGSGGGGRGVHGSSGEDDGDSTDSNSSYILNAR